ncbi:MAG TPA: hypothetical protein VK462_10220, partial [Nitrososphaeraceae archaeon]|nr:hypothetical protein [Nitrososphaeraceae archaeon]
LISAFFLQHSNTVENRLKSTLLNFAEALVATLTKEFPSIKNLSPWHNCYLIQKKLRSMNSNNFIINQLANYRD